MSKRQTSVLVAVKFILACTAAFAISYYVTPYLGKTATYLLLLLDVTLLAALLGVGHAVGLVVFATTIMGYFALSNVGFMSTEWLQRMFEAATFFLVGVVVSTLIEKFKKTDLAHEFKRKERSLQKEIEGLQEEKIKLQKEIKIRDEFLSITSHELKTPLTSMLLKLQTILHNIRNVSLAKFSVTNLLKMLETAEQQSVRLSRMINDLLNVSIMTTGRLNIEQSKEDLVVITKEVLEEFAERLEKGGYSLKLDAPKSISCYIDKLRIEQVITNLISNAMKYGGGKPIDVILTQSKSHARILVKDQGIGIPQEQAQKIFELFERGTNGNNSSYKGLGVGLYIANQIVKAHHGTIKVQSKPGTGSTFVLELPLGKPS